MVYTGLRRSALEHAFGVFDIGQSIAVSIHVKFHGQRTYLLARGSEKRCIAHAKEIIVTRLFLDLFVSIDVIVDVWAQRSTNSRPKFSRTQWRPSFGNKAIVGPAHSAPHSSSDIIGCSEQLDTISKSAANVDFMWSLSCCSRNSSFPTKHSKHLKAKSNRVLFEAVARPDLSQLLWNGRMRCTNLASKYCAEASSIMYPSHDSRCGTRVLINDNGPSTCISQYQSCSSQQ